MLNRHSKLVILFAGLSFLGGCSVGPHYKAPQPEPVKYHDADPQLVNDAPFEVRWWKQFDDPVLDSLMEKSLAANTSIRLARARLPVTGATSHQRTPLIVT